jgi:hypothetical protein
LLQTSCRQLGQGLVAFRAGQDGQEILIDHVVWGSEPGITGAPILPGLLQVSSMNRKTQSAFFTNGALGA